MGTSTRNPGQKGKSPLVPSWLDENTEAGIDLNASIPANADTQRFRMPRSNYTRYLNSNGTGRHNLRKSVSDYVKHSVGGSQRAVTRLGSARTSTAKLIGVINAFSRFSDFHHFTFDSLKGKKASDVFESIIDFVCPDGGMENEGISRSAYVDALLSCKELRDVNIEDMTIEQYAVLVKSYMGKVIFYRLLNDIGTQAISLPETVHLSKEMQNITNTYIAGAISDAFSELNINIGNISNEQTQTIADQIYEKTYSFLEDWGEDDE